MAKPIQYCKVKKKKKKCLTSGVSTNSKTTLDVSFNVLGLNQMQLLCWFHTVRKQHLYCLEKSKRFMLLCKVLGTHSSVLAWRIPGVGEPGGLPSMGSHRVGHN